MVIKAESKNLQDINFDFSIPTKILFDQRECQRACQNSWYTNVSFQGRMQPSPPALNYVGLLKNDVGD